MCPRSLMRRDDFFTFVEDAPRFFINATRDSIPIVTGVRCMYHQLEFLQAKKLRARIYANSKRRIIEYSFGAVYSLLVEKNKFSINKLFVRRGPLYVVNRFFTEGVQYVDENEVHVYQPEGQPLDVYVARFKGNQYVLNSFLRSQRSQFRRVRVRPREQFKLTHNTYYLVVAPTSTTFTKRICRKPSAYSNRGIQQHSEGQGCSNLIANCSKEATIGSNNEKAGALESIESAPRGDQLKVEETECLQNAHSDSNSLPKELSEKYRIGTNTNDYSMTMEHTPQVHLSDGTPPSVPQPHRNDDRESQGALDVSHEDISVHHNYGSGTKRKSCDIEVTLKRHEVETPAVIASSVSRKTQTATPDLKNSHIVQEVAGLLESGDDIIETKRELPQQSDVSATQSIVLGIRKDSQIESYNLCPGSTLEVHSDGSLTGSFSVENEDMDPNRLTYSVIENVIEENAFFKNGSTFKTSLLIQRNLVELLNNSSRKKEKVVVNYFFTSVYGKVEATFSRFVEMKNTGMIGSCVPAIVQMSGSQFSGVLPDTYEEI